MVNGRLVYYGYFKFNALHLKQRNLFYAHCVKKKCILPPVKAGKPALFTLQTIMHLQGME